jgi:hypothetical protein
MKGMGELLLCGDDSLGYRRSQTPISGEQKLQLDAYYRLAHLPLVNPAHPDVIKEDAAKGYIMGRHQRSYSLVLPIPASLLEQSEAYQEMQDALQKSPLSAKLAWDILSRRRDKLHATFCGGVGAVIPLEMREALQQTAPFEVELRGLFSGNINIGRFYLKLYPESGQKLNPIQMLQQKSGRNMSDLYLVGLHNLVDHLDRHETRWLLRFIEDWWDRPILRFKARELWHLSSHDDLVLDSVIEEHFDLGGK